MTDTTGAASRTTWPTAQPLQQAADIRRAAGDPLMADWLDATANALAWLAPYRDNEPGYSMWEAALAVARQVLGTTTGRAETEADGGRVKHSGPAAAFCVLCLSGEHERVADEQPETEAYPAQHRWRTETYDYLANEWDQGTPYTERADALARHQVREERFPTWKDGTPVQRRIVRETTTYTVEQQAAEAQQPETVLDGLEPIQLRWGLDDVMHGDDVTTTILLSGPDGQPYWLELDPERAAVLRDCLAGPTAEAQQPSRPCGARRRLTPNEHDRAWHAIEGSAGEEGADPGTVLNAVLHALRIDAPTAAEEQAASPSRRTTAPAEHCGHVVPTLIGDRRLIECVLRPGHSGSHADDHGMRWMVTTTRDAVEPTPAVAEETKPEVPVHACPGPDDNGMSPCCRRPPFEFRGERLTRDPELVTCPGPNPTP